ncbi:glycosyltransferase family 4 protein [Streptococcus sp. S784/96/1]|uniref:glycosyltransferase family 4 protein n=1 Tax=Streptococcus sp. S784/96/1 TaxID=2653499 RepID=UPI00138677FB|nr:glycosyltransferase family 4 protein [Streptococcus sp. S784/96/1]
MRIGLFTDTYFPQVSGVATSIRTLKEELEKSGHEVYIFTTTDKNVKRYEDPTIIRLPSVPFISFTDRRIAYRGIMTSLKIAKSYKLDIIHTQTEFSLGLLGKMVGRALKIPVVHTYHTQYEDYVGYIANGKLIRPSMVKYIVRGYLSDLDGVICPSRIVLELLDDYDVKIPKRIIPTGINLERFICEDICEADCLALRKKLGVSQTETMLLSVSRVSSEKNIQAVLRSLPEVLSENAAVKLVVAGDGPYLETLKEQAEALEITDHVIFTGMISPDEVALYYKACDFFISASTSETQGLTYLESLASGRPIIAHGNPYLDDLIDDKTFGTLYYHAGDLASAILDAIIDTPKITEQQLLDKRRAISAEQFGKAIHEFYLDVIISKSTQTTQKREKLSLTVDKNGGETKLLIESEKRSFPERLTKNTAQVVKAPLKLVRGIRNFLN